MAVTLTLPSGCYEQPDERTGVDANGVKTWDYVIKGPFDSLNAFIEGANALEPGEKVAEGWGFSSAQLQRRAGNLGLLTLHCSPIDTSTDPESGTTTQKALDETWTLKAVRNDISILAYCGPSEGNNPSRERIEAWMKEPDGELARENKYTRPDGTISTIAGADLQLVAKIRKGIDSVMRFYPMLTKTRTYSTPPLTVYENLAAIDTPSIGSAASADKLRYPGNLAAIISSHTWLKCQDDCSLLSDGKFQRIESWMGVPSSEGDGWDTDLYGTANRWEIPLGG